MTLTLLAKDRDSGNLNCPSVYIGDDAGWMYVQAEKAETAAYADVAHLLPGERVVRIKTQVVLDAVARMRTTGG